MSSHSLLRLHLGALAVEHLERLVLVGLRVRVDLFGGQHRPRRVAPARVADPGGEVADDQHHPVARLLELSQLGEHHHVAQVDVGRRARIDAELHAKRLALGELLLELPLGQGLLGPARQGFEVSHSS